MPLPHISLGVICGAILYLYQDEIKELSKMIYEYVQDKVSCAIIINTKREYKCALAIKEELKHNVVSKCNATDAYENPDYESGNGNYCVKYQNINIYISVEDEKITLRVLWQELSFLKRYMDNIYKEHCSTDNVLMFFTPSDGEWVPLYRRPRNIEVLQITDKMSEVLNDVQHFFDQENDYINTGQHFRRGYLLTGPTGKGKSTLIEMIAIKYNMSVYLLNFNGRKMDDNTLIKLAGTVPPRSILACEKMEKQLKCFDNYKYITPAGVLSLIDGVQRVSHVTIIITN